MWHAPLRGLLLRPALRSVRPLAASRRSRSAHFLDLLADMPKEEPHLKGLKDIRSRKRTRFSAQICNFVHFQIIGSNAPGGPVSLYLHTEKQRYLFNCGEGTQRLAVEHCPTRALAQLSDIFFTTKSWRNMGGFPGMCLTVRASGAPDLRVHGPPGCMSLFEATKKFIYLIDFDVLSHDARDGRFQDDTLSVEHIPLEYGGPAIVPEPPKYSSWNRLSSESFDAKGQKINPGPYHPEKLPPPIEPASLAYLLTIKGKPGKLLMDQCMKLKVPPGPLLGELKAGRDITLEDGTLVKSSDVMASDDPDTSALIIEVPDEAFLASIADENSALNQALASARNLSLIFHFTPSLVVNTAPYQAWMRRWSQSPKLQHVVLNDLNRGYGIKDVLSFNRKLRTLAPPLFPDLARHNLTQSLELSPEGGDGMKIHQGETGTLFHVRPRQDIQTLIEPYLDESAVDREIFSVEGMAEHLSAQLKKMVPDTTQPEFPKVTFFGTGSSAPAKYRSVTGILIETRPDTFIMLDCGEGTVLQMQRMYGRQRAQEILLSMKAVYISHLHADHHLGLITIMQERERAFLERSEAVEKLFILAPATLSHFLKYYHDEFEPVLTHAQQVKNEHLLLSTPSGSQIQTQAIYPLVLGEILEATGLKALATCRAVHCPSSFCMTLTTSEGDYKVAYTGDTRPNNALTQLCTYEKSPDLFIHEATMEHYLLADAKIKKHSTFTEAIDNGKRTHSKFTLLTHFSQRYSKFPVLDEIRDHERVGIAFDFMSVNPQTLPLIRHAYAGLEMLFPETVEEMRGREDLFKSKNPDALSMNALFPKKGGLQTSPPASPSVEPKVKKVKMAGIRRD